jgi:hypothetical protein
MMSGQSDRARRSTPNQVNTFYEAKRGYARYLALAQAASLAGDPIETENFYQHAEHYFRLMRK